MSIAGLADCNPDAMPRKVEMEQRKTEEATLDYPCEFCDSLLDSTDKKCSNCGAPVTKRRPNLQAIKENRMVKFGYKVFEKMFNSRR